MRRFHFFMIGQCLMTGLLSVTLLAAPLAAQTKKRVAVMNFEYGTISTSVAQIFGTNVDIGKGIADMLVDRLVNDGTYSVIERKALDKVLAEQNFSNSDRADPTSAAKLARILGVDAIIVGSITQFGRDDKSTGVGGGVASRVSGRFGVGGISTKSSKAVVQVTARMINTETAEILASAAGKGESKRDSTSLLGAGGGSIAGGAGVDMRSSNFGETILGEATNDAVTQVAMKLKESNGRIPARVIAIDGLVADVSGKTLVLNIGRSGGLKVGDRLRVMRVGREIKDPATGKVIRRSEDALGEVQITEVDDSSSVGTYVGAGAVKVGDRIKSQ